MPIFGRWRPLSSLPTRRRRDAMPGVYELADAQKQLIYIGQSQTDVPNRIRQHLERSECIMTRALYWRYEYSRIPASDEAAHIARHVSQYGNLPLCNRATPLTRSATRRYQERSQKS
jgi:hypothetical protein